MKALKTIAAFAAATLAVSSVAVYAATETVTLDMQDAGYGINAGKSFTADGITMYESTLGDLAELYDTIDFTISAADLGGRDDLLFQVYVSADNWAIWANNDETPAIEAAGTEYKYSLNVDDIADKFGSDKVICDMGFQILSGTAGKVEVTYSVEFNAGGVSSPDDEATAATDNGESGAGDTSASAGADKANADTGIEGVAVVFGAAALAAMAVMVTKRRRS